MIPILGMVLGNTISGISLGLVTTVEELMTGVWLGVCARALVGGDGQRAFCISSQPLVSLLLAQHNRTCTLLLKKAACRQPAAAQAENATTGWWGMAGPPRFHQTVLPL
jgi:hypothetical protein